MPISRTLATSIAALPFLVALGLYATGTLERIDNAIEKRTDRQRFGVDKPKRSFGQPLAQYAGWWQRDAVPPFGTEWVARVIVRTEGDRAWLRMWHECRPNYCEQGEFEAEIFGKIPDDVYALQVVRKRAKDVLWIVGLHPNGNDNPNSLVILDERRARNPQKNPMDNQSSVTALRRVK